MSRRPDMPPLRLAFDARMALHGGIGTYVRHLLSALIESKGLDHLCVIGAPSNTLTTSTPGACRTPFQVPVYSLWEQVCRLPNPHHATLWHSPHFNLPGRWTGPLAVTIHDLIHLKDTRYARTWLARPYAGWLLRQAIRRAGKLIAGSEAAKQDLCEWGRVPPDRVAVIPHGVADDFRIAPGEAQIARVLRAHHINPPFVLWVSTIRPHKNPLVILRAFAQMIARHEIPHRLVMVGHLPRWYREPVAESRRLGLGERVIWTGPVPEADLPVLYHAARLLVMPSHLEGFGLPVLEAMAAGLPTLVSSTPALAELVANPDVMVKADDVDAWSGQLYNGLFNDDFRRAIRQHGLARSAQFTWRRTADLHLDVYRAILGR